MTSNLNTYKIRGNSNKILAIFIAILLLASCAAILNPTAKGQTVLRTLPTETFMSISPNPAGVNQSVTLFVFLNLEPSEISGTAYYGWNFTITVTDPNGHNTTLTPPETLPTGYTYIGFTPTMIGQYQIQANFAQLSMTFTATGAGAFIPGNYIFLASQSTVKTLNVTSTTVNPWPDVPLPTAYWQNPVYSTNYQWYSLINNWLGGVGGGAPTTTTGPLSPHILWTRPLAYGGLSGGTQDGSPLRGTQGPGYNYYTGLLYQNKLTEFIIDGYMIYNIQPQEAVGVICVSLRTGAVVWENDTMPNISFANVPTYNMGLGSGSLAYLWFTSGTTLYQVDAFNGRVITCYINAQTMSAIQGPNGEILSYTLNYAAGWMTMWNSTRAVEATGSGSNTTASTMSPTAGESYTPYATFTRNWQAGIQWNVTVTPVNAVVTGVSTAPTFTYGQLDYKDGVLVAVANFFTNTTNPIFEDIGYSAATGAQLWAVNRTNIGWGEGGPTSPGLYVFSGYTFGSGVYAFYERETLQWHIINIFTGQEQAVTPPLNTLPGVSDWSYYDWHANIANGIMYTAGYSGEVCAFNITTGQNMWVFNEGNSGVQDPFGDWPTYGGVTITNGVVYYGPTEHTPPTPMYRGFSLYAINATTGALIWQTPAFFTSMAESDGILVGYDGYDNQIYAYGTGLSATTVTTEPVLNNPAQVLIKGTVTDQSPGQTCLGIPEAGTPAIADAYQGQWSAYLFKSQPEPMNATGVPVTLTAIDPNGNFVNIGTTTSDINGQYSYVFTPDVPGTYEITASFAGTASYYASSSETIMGFAMPTAATAAPTATPTSVANTYFVPAITGLAVLIIVGLIALALLMLRKKP